MQFCYGSILGLFIHLQWPNDIYLGGQTKIGGCAVNCRFRG